MPSAITISQAQFAALSEGQGQLVIDGLRRHIDEQFPDIAAFGDVDALIREAMRRANAYGFATLAGYAHFVNFIALAGPDFDRRHLDSRAETVRAELKRGDQGDGFARVYSLLDAAP